MHKRPQQNTAISAETDLEILILCFDLFVYVDQSEQVTFGLTSRVFELIEEAACQFSAMQVDSPADQTVAQENAEVATSYQTVNKAAAVE